MSSGIVLETRPVFSNAETTVQDLQYGQILVSFWSNSCAGILVHLMVFRFLISGVLIC